ncbi:CDP-alcohol phosphatidyltransferase family protein [Pelagibius litoralis]|uniref:CDP-alcohol phosphatidyltransferase family protein n=1 Tax=Pelagibius litoralis TaxID=374515 RepID=A0A967CC52_9PROT|nr:CDP-alcohol phosphatidyltransferase family protein [Pelagibius litoralis]NIA68833.1 CDP-alcohol phosphatidyltransferase family protein [Pelagibius litoralis]
MTGKLARLWATKTVDDEWWSSFVTAPMAIAVNYGAVEAPWITPNRITGASFLVAVVASLCIVIGGSANFIAAAVLIHLSHMLDCMDGQMARYRQVSSPIGSYYDRLTDQVQVTLWFGAAGYAAYLQSSSVTPVVLALIGIALYGLRGYTKYIAIEIETGRDPGYLAKMSQWKKPEKVAGLGFGLRANLTWFAREQRKIFHFDEGVFIFMLSAALLFDALEPMLWIFAGGQLFWGLYRAVQHGRQIQQNHQLPILK